MAPSGSFFSDQLSFPPELPRIPRSRSAYFRMSPFSYNSPSGVILGEVISSPRGFFERDADGFFFGAFFSPYCFDAHVVVETGDPMLRFTFLGIRRLCSGAMFPPTFASLFFFPKERQPTPVLNFFLEGFCVSLFFSVCKLLVIALSVGDRATLILRNNEFLDSRPSFPFNAPLMSRF